MILALCTTNRIDTTNIEIGRLLKVESRRSIWVLVFPFLPFISSVKYKQILGLVYDNLSLYFLNISLIFYDDDGLLSAHDEWLLILIPRRLPSPQSFFYWFKLFFETKKSQSPLLYSLYILLSPIHSVHKLPRKEITFLSFHIDIRYNAERVATTDWTSFFFFYFDVICVILIFIFCVVLILLNILCVTYLTLIYKY